jgi:REP element-mobilizing transposase RayT
MVDINKFDPLKQRRHSIRMKGYDYSLAGAYFVTIVTYQRRCLFGEIVNGDIILNPSGRFAFEQWTRLGKRFQQSDFSTFVIMPNHAHGIIYLVRGAGEESQTADVQIPPLRLYLIPNVTPGSLGAIVRAYKAAVTYRINALRGFTDSPIWQRNYYEHIIRNEKDYETIWNYIETNPRKWMDDQLNLYPTST